MQSDLSTTPLIDDNASHILVVDDDTRIRTLLAQFLQERGYRITTAADAAEARRKLLNLDFDLIVLDVMMPGETGVELTQSIRKVRDIPILLLTALSEIDARVIGLEAGADDYLAKPFDPRELLLRVNNILRRGAPAVSTLQELVAFGPFTFHIVRRELKRGADIIRLTDREQEIMVQFSEKPGETVPRHELVKSESEIGERTIDVQINRLRRKIEVDPANPIYLQTVRGIGYRLSVERQEP